MIGRETVFGERTFGWWSRAVVGLIVLLFGVALASPAKAETLTVTKSADTQDWVCDADCSLREAIHVSNSKYVETITFTEGISKVYVDSSESSGAGFWLRNGGVTIKGPGADQLTIQKSLDHHPLFEFGSGFWTIEGLTMSGGGVFNGYSSSVRLNGIAIRGASSHLGGAVYNSAGMRITNSTISNNRGVKGAAIYNESLLTIANSTISNNRGVDPTNFGHGSGTAQGGAIFNAGSAAIANSTISGNTSYEGGGIFNTDVHGSPGFVQSIVINSTISGNRAAKSGGGIKSEAGTTEIERSTITGNTAPENAGGGVLFGGEHGNSTLVRHSIISNNSSSDLDIAQGASRGEVVSYGSNVIGTGNATDVFSKTGDKTEVTNPGLGDLSDNGGPTRTHALFADSPAIDAVEGACDVLWWDGKMGDGTVLADLSGDQRGTSRPQGAACDVGAFEAVPDATKPIISGNSPKGVTQDTTPTIKATVKDDTTSLAKDDIKLSVDGNEKTDFSYDETTDQLTYTTGSLTNGSHRVSISATDAWGNTSEMSWDFTVETAEPNVDTDTTKPTISRFSPKVRTFDRTPKIKAIVKDNATDLRKGNIKLYVDGKKKGKFRYNRSKNKLVYQSKRLSYKRHSVRIVVRDEAGNVAKKTWRFKVMKRR